MKKILSIFVLLFCLISLSSCREDADFDDKSNFDFNLGLEVLSDNDGTVNSSTELTFNLLPSYDFEKLNTHFKIASSKSGDIALNGTPLSFNKVYSFENLTNELVYIGKIKGDHRVSIVVYNDFGVRKEYSITLNYNE